MLKGTGKDEIALAEEQRLVKVLRALDVFDMARTGYRDLVFGRVTRTSPILSSKQEAAFFFNFSSTSRRRTRRVPGERVCRHTSDI